MVIGAGSSYSEDFFKKAFVLTKFWNERDRKLNPAGSGIGIKKQKILFFYNVFSKVNNKEYSFENLKAFKDGPVYNDIYYEVTVKNVFIEYLNIPENISANEEEFKIAEIIVSSLTNDQLSELTHKYNCWRKKYSIDYVDKVDAHDMDFNNIMPEDFDEHDELITKSLFDYFSNIYKNYILHKSKNNILAIKKKDYEKVVNELSSALDYIEENINPVRIELEDGGIVIDY